MSARKNTGPASDIQELVEETFFKQMEEVAAGTLATDADGIIVWMDDKYARLLNVAVADVIGKYIVEVLPTSRIPEVLATGEAIPLDLMKYPNGWCVVSRFPVLDAECHVHGAFGFVLFDSPTKSARLLQRFHDLRERRSDRGAIAAERAAHYRIADFVGASAHARAVRAAAAAAATSTGTVLILGPSGSGKEIVAQAIHNASCRAASPFVAINIGAVPETLVEAELFGVVHGAFTGADSKGREGKIQLADNGTLFLDEIGDMPLPVQAKLLRFLEERTVEALGSNRLKRVDVRVVAATSADLKRLLREGRFRTDLYYRLNILPITLRKLDEHKDDIPMLAGALLERFGPRDGGPRRLTGAAVAMLAERSWPGNVRELRNVLERAALLIAEVEIDADRLRGILELEGEATEVKSSEPAMTLARAIESAEQAQIARALAGHRNNLSSAARALGISRTTLYRKAKLFGLLVGDGQGGELH